MRSGLFCNAHVTWVSSMCSDIVIDCVDRYSFTSNQQALIVFTCLIASVVHPLVSKQPLKKIHDEENKSGLNRFDFTKCTQNRTVVVTLLWVAWKPISRSNATTYIPIGADFYLFIRRSFPYETICGAIHINGSVTFKPNGFPQIFVFDDGL